MTPHLPAVWSALRVLLVNPPSGPELTPEGAARWATLLFAAEWSAGVGGPAGPAGALARLALADPCLQDAAAALQGREPAGSGGGGCSGGGACGTGAGAGSSHDHAHMHAAPEKEEAHGGGGGGGGGGGCCGSHGHGDAAEAEVSGALPAEDAAEATRRG